jgi:hypothetical protein
MESYIYNSGKKKDVKPAHESSHGPDALRYAFSKDLRGIFPEIKRIDKAEEFKKCFNEKGEYVPPAPTLAQILDIKDKRNVKKPAMKEKEPGECFPYEPKYNPWASEE